MQNVWHSTWKGRKIKYRKKAGKGKNVLKYIYIYTTKSFVFFPKMLCQISCGGCHNATVNYFISNHDTTAYWYTETERCLNVIVYIHAS